MPPKVELSSMLPAPNSEVRMLGVEGALKWRVRDPRLTIEVPGTVRQSPPCRHAFVFKIAVGVERVESDSGGPNDDD